MRELSQRTFINILFAFAFLILTASALLVYKEMRQMYQANRMVIHTHNVLTQTDQLQFMIDDLESRINYFLLTDNPVLLSNFAARINLVNTRFSNLRTLTMDNPEQQKRLNRLEPLLKTKLDHMPKIINAAISNNKAMAVQLAQSKERFDIKTQIAAIIADINRSEVNLLQARNNDLQKEMSVSNFLIGLMALFGSSIFILSFILLNYYLHKRSLAEKRRAEVEQELLLSNEQLKESEERYLLATEGSNAGIWDWKLVQKEMYFSPYFRKILDYDVEEFPNSLQSLDKNIYSEDRQRVWDAVNQHLKNRTPFDIEFRLRTKSGRHKWVHASGQALWDEQGRPIRMSGGIVDVTPRKIAEKYLSLQYDITRVLIESNDLRQMAASVVKLICSTLYWKTGAMWILNKKTNIFECIGYWQHPSVSDNAFEQATRRTKFHPHTGLIRQLEQSKEPVWENDIHDAEHFTRKSDASRMELSTAFYFPVFVRGRLIGVFEFLSVYREFLDDYLFKMMSNIGAMVEEFIKRIKSEGELKQSEYYKTAILESASDSILTINKEGSLLSYNWQTIKMFQYQPHELKNINVNSLIPALTHDVHQYLNKELKEVNVVCKDGRTLPCEVSMTQMPYEGQMLYVLTIRDITERKKVDIMKNEFISIVSHELRTPLTSIQGSLDLMADGTAGPLTEDAQELVKVAKQNSDRLIRLINDILDIEKIESGKMEFKLKLLDINGIVKEAIALNQAYAQKFQVTIKLQASTQDVMVTADHDKLLQALANLISNAVKFSPPHSEVVIRINQPANKIVRVSITDKGLGITKEFQPKIFQKFAQQDSSTTRRPGGTGLGLSITKAIIENLRGKIDFSTEENVGTTFYFDLPVSEKQKAAATPEKTLVNTNGQSTILICEDEPDTLHSLQSMFNEYGFKTIVCNSVSQAKQIIASDKVDALVFDVVQPDYNGISFIKELRTWYKTKSLPIVVVSVSPKKDEAQLKGAALSVLDWINKPIDQTRLKDAVKSIKEKLDANTMKILYVEDDTDLSDVVAKILESEAKIVCTTNLNAAKIALDNDKFDLAILDLLLADGSGLELLPEFSKRRIPVIVFSAYELPENYAQYVKSALIKSKTSSKEFLEIVKQNLKSQKEVAGG